MRKANAALSLVPQYDATVYLVLDDYGSIGRVYRETDEGEADLETIISTIQIAQYKRLPASWPSMRPKMGAGCGPKTCARCSGAHQTS
jgi:hypothetical protein